RLNRPIRNGPRIAPRDFSSAIMEESCLLAAGAEIAFAKAVVVKPFAPALASTLTMSSWLHAIGCPPKRGAFINMHFPGSGMRPDLLLYGGREVAALGRREMQAGTPRGGAWGQTLLPITVSTLVRFRLPDALGADGQAELNQFANRFRQRELV